MKGDDAARVKLFQFFQKMQDSLVLECMYLSLLIYFAVSNWKKKGDFTGESAGPLGPPGSGALPSVLLFYSLDTLIFHNGCFGSY